MGSSMDSARWTCPHCFSVISWSDPEDVRNHTCKEIRRLISQVRERNTTAKLDAMIAVLTNPNQRPKLDAVKPKRKRKEKNHGT